jgi:hypothetical protein
MPSRLFEPKTPQFLPPREVLHEFLLAFQRRLGNSPHFNPGLKVGRVSHSFEITSI